LEAMIGFRRPKLAFLKGDTAILYKVVGARPATSNRAWPWW
jgi:hypothetical protein